MKYWMLNHVPNWFRFRWPLKRYFWQSWDIECMNAEAKKFEEFFK